MIGYPNRKGGFEEKHDISYAHRGMSLEDDINATNKHYLDNDIAAIYKKPTPVTIVSVDYKSRETARITEAYFQVPSTTDYNGVYRGKYVDFEAKETHSKTSMNLNIIHPHQIKHLERVVKYGGIAFLIVRFVAYEETYFVRFEDFSFKMRSQTAKSIKREWFQEKGYLIPYRYNAPVDYLKAVDRIIDGGNVNE